MSLTLTIATLDQPSVTNEPLEVAHVIEDNEVYLAIRGRLPTGVAMAEVVKLAILRICQMHDLNLRRHVFFEVRTHRASLHLNSSQCDIKRVDIGPRKSTKKVPAFSRFKCITILPGGGRPTTIHQLRGMGNLIPSAIVDAFAPIIA